ncbi:hypothetical protein [Streptomyces sp. NPDC002463]|uniref:hypothetical protein n=1 Tax=Streptomyces sp. NPDC002463 TaxID=3364645 RepID=UPI0036832C45
MSTRVRTEVLAPGLRSSTPGTPALLLTGVFTAVLLALLAAARDGSPAGRPPTRGDARRGLGISGRRRRG